ncbi:MAG: type IV toxin-antitoxin system AbiEi family antitoxin domain-containing protein [Promethearchaeota archaeon]
MNDSQIKKYFQENGWYLTWNQMVKLKISQYELHKLLKSNNILKLSHGLYKWNKVDFEYEDLFDISHIQSEGVFCLYTALNFYNLTSFMPKVYYFVVPRTNRIKLGLKQYPIVVKKWIPKYFNLGIIQFKLGKYSIRMYDIEKTICDCIRYKQKIGLLTIKEVLTSYLRSNLKDIQKLSKYAGIMGIDKQLKDFIGMII